ncbi:phage tail tip lysozyme [Singulisphaera sp. PoT]|uniref:phage tail tip lysozyme n=1 Tax=Singulisphaera sp. PoT TaxID=3411797 RepID=UPI003BF5F0AD
MTVLDTFYLIFKSNAGDTKADIGALDRQIGDLAAKGAKRSDDESKKLKELRKQRQEMTQDLKDQKKVVEGTGEAFVKVVETATAAAAAIFSLGAIKDGVMNAAKFNSDLQVQGKLLGQNAADIKAYGAAVQSAGGSAEGFQSALKTAFSAASEAGLPLPPVDVLMRRYHDAIKGMTPTGAANYLSRLGVSDPGMMALLEQSDAEFEKSIATAREHVKVTEADTQAARDFEQAWSRAAQSLDTIFTKIGTDVLPVLTGMLDSVTKLTDALGGDKGTWHERVADWIMDPDRDADIRKKYRNGIDNNAMDFWMSQGYTRSQAAGIVANEMRESGGNPDAVGDGGKARGLYQWHPDRADAILRGTGIDVRSASAADQRRAAAWELQQTGLADRLKQIDDPDAAAAFVSQRFERPANGGYEAMIRGKSALEIASASPFSSAGTAPIGGASNRTTSVKIDEINVHTQATDAAGISGAIGDELAGHLRTTVSNFDDGIAY